MAGKENKIEKNFKKLSWSEARVFILVLIPVIASGQDFLFVLL